MAGRNSNLPNLTQGVQTRTGGLQSTLDKSLKRVNFNREEEVDGKFKEMGREIKRLREKLEEEGRERLKLEARVRKLEENGLKLEGERVQDRKDNIEWARGMGEIRERLEGLERKMGDLMENSGGGTDGSELGTGSNAASGSVGRVAGSRHGSTWSLASGASGLTNREVSGLEKLMLERDRREREDNIVIRGLGENDLVGGDLVKLAGDFLRDRLGVEVEVRGARRSGAVLVVRMGSREAKAQVMGSKSRLKGSAYFVEHDLSYEDRKTQEEMVRWAKEVRAKGKDVKVGQGAVKIDGRWVRWRDMGGLRDDNMGEERGREKGAGEEGEERKGEE